MRPLCGKSIFTCPLALRHERVGQARAWSVRRPMGGARDQCEPWNRQ